MNSIGKHQRKKRLNVCVLLIFITLFFPLVTRAQNVDSLVRVINHSQSAEDINNAKKNIPGYLQKVDMKMLGVIRQMKAQGITRANAPKQQLRDRFSTPLVELDDLGNLHAEIYLKQLDESYITKLKALGIVIEYTDQSFKRVT